MYRLKAKNFQSWGDLDLPVTGFTVIVGKSDMGKSAALRALKGIVRNEVGAAHVSHGKKTATVSLVTDNKEITLTRGKTTTYEVDGEEYSKLAGGVPPAVKDLNFGPVEVGNVKLDPVFAGQFDSPFMLDLSPAELSLIFGLFSSTEKLNYGKKVVSQKIQELNATAKFLASETQKAELTKAQLQVLVDKMDQSGEIIFALERKINTLDRVTSSMRQLISRLGVKNNYSSFSSSPLPSIDPAIKAARNLFYLKEYAERNNKCFFLRTFFDSCKVDSSSLPTLAYRTKLLFHYNNKNKNSEKLREFSDQSLPSIEEAQKLQGLVVRMASYKVTKKRVDRLKGIPLVPENDLSPVFRTLSLLTNYANLKKSFVSNKKILESSNIERKGLERELKLKTSESIKCPKCGYFFNGDKNGNE